MEKIGVSLLIGAGFSAGFQQIIGSTTQKINTIGDALSAITRRDTKLKLLHEAETDLESLKSKLAQSTAEMDRLRSAFASAPRSNLLEPLRAAQKEVRNLRRELEVNPSPALAESLQKAKAEVQRLKVEIGQSPAAELEKSLKKATTEVEQLTAKLPKAESDLARAKIAHQEAAMAAEKQSASLGRLGASLEKLKARHEAMSKASMRFQNAQAQLGSARAGLFDAVAVGVGLQTVFSDAAKLQTVLTDIAITADIPRHKMAQIGEALTDVAAKTGQTRAELAGGLQVMIAAGMNADAAMATIEAVGKTATASGAAVDDVAKTMFSAFDNLKVAPGDAIKAMDMLTAAGKAGRFELRDMAKYFPALTADAQKLGITGTQAVASLGAALQVALKGAADPAEAANNMKNYMAKLTAPETVRNFKKMGIDIAAEMQSWAAQGLNPIEESLALVQRLTGGDAFKIGNLFGDMQVKGFITPMLQQMGEYKRIKAEVESASGTVDKDMARRRGEDPAQAYKRMGEALAQLRDAVIIPLLPSLTRLGEAMASIAGSVGAFARENSTLVSVIGTTLGLLLGGKVAFAAVSYGIGLVKVAWTGLSLALAANPLGVAIAAIGLAATVIYANWDKIAPLFAHVGTAIASTGEWLQRSFFDIASGIGTIVDGLKAVFSWSPLGLIVNNWTAIATFFSGVPAQMQSIGSAIVDGLGAGMVAKFESMKATVTQLGGAISGWFKEKLGIHSPSRVFAGFGQNIGEGARLGITSMIGAVALASSGLAGAAQEGFGKPNLHATSSVSGTGSGRSAARTSQTAMPGRVPAAPTETQTTQAAKATPQPAGTISINQTITIQINQAGGENVTKLAERVAAEIRRATDQARRAALGDMA